MSSCGQNLPLVEADVSHFTSSDDMKKSVKKSLSVDIGDLPDICRGLICPHHVPLLTPVHRIIEKPELEGTYEDHRSPTIWCLQKQWCKLIVFGTIASRKISNSAVCWMSKKKEFCERISGV